MGQFTATTLGLLEAACALALAAAIVCLAVAQTRRARRADDSERRRASLLDAVRRARREPLLAACEQARTRENVREDVRVVARGLALAPQRSLLIEAARDAGLDDALHNSLASTSADVRARAAALLGLLRLAHCSELEPLLADPDGNVRLVAARAIAMLDTPEAAVALIRALGSAEIDANRLIEQLARPSAIPELVRAFDAPEHSAVRPLIAEALGLTRSVAAIALLSSLVRVGVEDERVRACRGLGRIAQPEVVPLLVEALADDAWAVRAEAARWLTGLGDHSSIPELERALSDGAWWVRANAADALRSIGPAGLAALVRASQSDDRVTAARAREALAVEDGADRDGDESLGLAA
jgi:HEAT repeat protein